MKHHVWFYQVICIESGSCCTAPGITNIVTGKDTKKLAEFVHGAYNSTLPDDHLGDDLKLEDIEIKDGESWQRTSTCGDLIYIWQVKVVSLDIEVTFPFIHYHEDGVELEVK